MHYISNFKPGRRKSVEVPESDNFQQNMLDSDTQSMMEGGETSQSDLVPEESQVSLEKESEAIFPMFSEIKKLF
jgi:hypothetical protein